MNRTVRFAAKWIGVATLTVAFCELTVRVWNIEPVYQLQGKGIAGGTGLQIFTLDPDRLFRIRSSPAHHINSLGFRDVEFDTKKSSPRVLVLGDSFPMGLVVEESKTFPKVLERKLAGVQVYNLGVQGYGPDQSLVVLQEIGLALDPDLIVLSLYPANDFDDLIKNGMITVKDDKLEEVHPNFVERVLPRLHLLTALRFVTTGHFLPPDTEQELGDLLFNDKGFTPLSDPERFEQSVTLMRATLKRFVEVARDHHIPIVAVIIPSYHEIVGEGRSTATFNYEKKIGELCQEVGLTFFDSTPSFQEWSGPGLYSEADRHLSTAGHELVASLLARRAELATLGANRAEK